MPRWLEKNTGSLKRLLIWIAVLSIWEAAFRFVGWRPWIFPAPSHILDALAAMLNLRAGFGEPLAAGWPYLGTPAAGSGLPGGIWTSALIVGPLVSGVRLLIGFVLSVLLGMTVGLAMWRSANLDRLLGPLFLGMQTLPSVCWIPLAIIIFGINEKAILFVLVMGSAFAVGIALRDGLRQIPPVYQHAGAMLGARGWKLYWYVLFPASLPALASSLRQGFSFAWRSLMGAEFVLVAVKYHGLGYLLETGRNFADVAQVMGVMMMMVMLGMAADRFAFGLLERRVHARFGLNGAR